MPDWINIVRNRIAPLRLEPAAECSLAEELAQHLEDRYHEYRSGGAVEEEAIQKALSELDDLYPLRAELQGRHGMAKYDPVQDYTAPSGNFMGEIWRDLRFAVRTMRKSPLFVFSVVLILALGIGANTTVFTVINTLILNPLPVPDSSGLMGVGLAKVGTISKPPPSLPISYSDLKDYQAKNAVFRSLAGYTSPRIVTWHTGGGRIATDVQ
jgi:hypothetical protein